MVTKSQGKEGQSTLCHWSLPTPTYKRKGVHIPISTELNHKRKRSIQSKIIRGKQIRDYFVKEDSLQNNSSCLVKSYKNLLRKRDEGLSSNSPKKGWEVTILDQFKDFTFRVIPLRGNWPWRHRKVTVRTGVTRRSFNDKTKRRDLNQRNLQRRNLSILKT